MGGPTEQNAGKKRWRWLLIAIFLVLLLAVSAVLAIVINWPLPGQGRLFSADKVVQIADVSSQRLLALGSVVGFAAPDETHAWLGIPYARPPLADLRWRAPQSPEAWADTFDALAFGPPCVQLAAPIGGVSSDEADGFAGEEDCLYLNVWAPRREADQVASAGERLPVMVWIHAGDNRIGHSGNSSYDGARLAGTEEVVVVSFNYRLGPFGWFSHPALRASARDSLEASGNFGTLDQIRALSWVQANIEEFGGDPNNVTVFGASAGGTNVLALLVVDAARGLFHRAIAQSASTDSVSRAEAENALTAEVAGQRHSSAEIVVSLFENAGVVPDRDAARGYAESLPDADLLAFLRARPSREIVDAYRDPERPDQLEVPRLIRDGALLPIADWFSEIRAGRFHHVPILLGANRDAMKLFLSQDEKRVMRRFSIFYRIRNTEDYARRSRYHSELWAVRAVVRPATAITDSGYAEVFAYRFDWDEEPVFLGTDLSELFGAAQGFEIPFVFGNFEYPALPMSRVLFDESSRPGRLALSAAMMGYWAEFAREGRPGRGGQIDQPTWPRWTQRRFTNDSIANGSIVPMAPILVLDTREGGGIRLAEMKLSREEVIAAVDAERGLDQNEKCALFLDLFSGLPEWSLDEYRGIGRRGCADFPPMSAVR